LQKSFRGLGHSPTSFEEISKAEFLKNARVAIHEHCLPMQSGYRRAQLANSNCELASSGGKWRVWQHRLCLLSAKMQSVRTPAVLAIL